MVSHIALLVVMTIRFKYFLSIEQPVQMFLSGDVIFISGKFVIEDSELCFIVAYLSIVDNNNPNCEFDTTNVPLCIPYCIYSVVVNQMLRKVDKFIHFGAETIEYNSVTGSNTWALWVQATNIDYIKTPTISINSSKSSSLSASGVPTIINIFNKSINSAFTESSKKNIEASNPSSAIIVYDHIDLDPPVIEIKSDNNDEALEDKSDEQEEEL
ncbi:24640_t:CDS:2 [Cetraspora pellucida]|uniref:24640_t:CDS:1 n=1 Tax=Cetraspora pellucida TaxID=1433469 RepID=A0A9N9IZK2_9GLOM|nr:24640_t:CDS:2 [Cetraspora pellucida]